MKSFQMCESEYRFANIVWQNEPLGSGELVGLCREKLGWKKSTTYTVLKKLCERGVLKNENAVVTSLVPQEQVQQYESEQFVNEKFAGSLPAFIAAFLNDRKLDEQQISEIQKLIDQSREEAS